MQSRLTFFIFIVLVTLSISFLIPVTTTAREEVIVGIYQIKPLVFWENDGKAEGIYIDLLSSISRAEDVRFIYKKYTRDICLAQLDSGEIDVMVGIGYSETRDHRYRYSTETILSNWGQICVPSSIELNSILDLEGKRIAVLEGDIYYEELKSKLTRFGVCSTFREYLQYEDILRAVSRNEVDAGLINRLYGQQMDHDFAVQKTNLVCCPVELRFAFSNDSNSTLISLFDNHIAALKADQSSIYYKSLHRWMNGGHSEKVIPRWVYINSLVLIISLVATVFIVFWLKRLVNQKTAELQGKNKQLVFEISERQAGEARLKKSLEEKEVLLREIHHRVKNNMQVIISLLNLQRHYMTKENVAEKLTELQYRIQSMALVHESLYQADDVSRIDITDYIANLLQRIQHSYPAIGTSITIEQQTQFLKIPLNMAIPCGLIINELISNCLKHAFPENRSGTIVVKTERVNSELFSIVIADNGIGLSPDTLSGKENSLGLELVGMLVEQLDGELEIRTDGGTDIRCTFPSDESDLSSSVSGNSDIDHSL